MSDLNTKLQLATALATIETLGRELPIEEALELFRHLGTRSAVLRQRLSREGCFNKAIANGRSVTVLSAVVAAKVG